MRCKCADILHILNERVALLPGSRDRANRPVIYLPARVIETQINSDHLRNLFVYLYEITSDDAREKGFIFVIDMRKGTTWEIIKPILKYLDEHFIGRVSCVLIIKPDKLFEKLKVSTTKYKFEVNMISAESLKKYIDGSQLLQEFGGNLAYDHVEWIDLRLDIEKLLFRLIDILRHFESYSKEMNDDEMPIDVYTAEQAIEKHQRLYSLIITVSVDAIESDVKELKKRVMFFSNNYKNGCPINVIGVQLPMNPDFASVFIQITELVNTLVTVKNDLAYQWEARKTRLYQCSQQRIFEQDAENLLRWILNQSNQLSNRMVFIGESELENARLLKDHLELADSVKKIEVSYNQVLTVGQRLMDFQSFGKNKIESLSQQLRNQWSQFIIRIDQRTDLLNLVLISLQKCNLFLDSTQNWQETNSVGVDPQNILDKSHEDMLSAVQEHMDFLHIFQTSYTEAFSEINQLMRVMKKYFGEGIVQVSSYKQIQELLQQITRVNRQIHGIWRSRKETLQYKISSAVFLSDMRSVLDWIDQYGEPFLLKKIGIGTDRESSDLMSKNHENFCEIAENTCKNAGQIFTMAEVLKNAGEMDSIEATKGLNELRVKIENFREKISYRTHLLIFACNFFLHYDEIMAWYLKMDQRASQINVMSDKVEECERSKNKLQSENDGTVQAYERVMTEGKQLLGALHKQHVFLNVNNTESISHVENLIRSVESRHFAETERWPEHRLIQNTALKISTFLRDCHEIMKQLEGWRQDMQALRHSVTNTAENEANTFKRFHNQNAIVVQNVVVDAIKQRDEIILMLQNKNCELFILSSHSEEKQIAKDLVVVAASKLQQVEKDVMDIAKDVSNRIELSLQMGKLKRQGEDVASLIGRVQTLLLKAYRIPGESRESDMFLNEFLSFQAERYESLNFRMEQFYNARDEFVSLPLLALDSHAETRNKICSLSLDIKSRWDNFVGLLDLRGNLLNAAMEYYYNKKIFTFCDSIERKLRADCGTDFCKSIHFENLEDCFLAVQKRLIKYRNEKQNFFNVTSSAQRSADNFIKRIRFSEHANKGLPAPHHMHISECCTRIKEIEHFKDSVRERQTTILHLLVELEVNIERCRGALRLQLLASDIVKWIDKETKNCLEISDKVKNIKQISEDSCLPTRDILGSMLEQCLELKDLLKVKRYDEVRKLTQGSKQYKEQNARVSDVHVKEVDQSFTLVWSRLQTISILLIECENLINKELASNKDVDCQTSSSDSHVFVQKRLSDDDSLNFDRFSDSTIEEKIGKEGEKDILSEKNQEIMRPMNELIQTERVYIYDLKRCIDVYLSEYQSSGSMCPFGLRQKEYEIFGNLRNIYEFHSNRFLNSLLAYERSPEDVGYCFIDRMEELKELYIEYCLNHERNNYLLNDPDALKLFNDIQDRNNLELSQNFQSHIIKPVQRITKYHMILKELMKRCTKNITELQNAHEIMSMIPKNAVDKMQLESFKNYEKYKVGEFVMQDSFVVSEPKRYFKRERDMQVFLFESNIVFTKKEELQSKKIGYLYKDSMLLREIHIVEHIEGDTTKFGLRKSSLPHHQNDHNTTTLKANTEANKIYWIKTLRDLKMDMKRVLDEKSTVSNSSTTRASSNASSSVKPESTSNNIFRVNSTNHESENRVSIHSLGSNASLPTTSTNKGSCSSCYIVVEDFHARNSDQISVKAGQKVEILDRFEETPSADSSSDLVNVAILASQQECHLLDSGVCTRGMVPLRILRPCFEFEIDLVDEAEASSFLTPTSSNFKTTPLRRFFHKGSDSKTGSNSQQHQQEPQPLKVLSSVQRISQPTTTATTTHAEPTTSSARSVTAVDLDLPPPMNQLGSPLATSALPRVYGSAGDGSSSSSTHPLDPASVRCSNGEMPSSEQQQNGEMTTKHEHSSTPLYSTAADQIPSATTPQVDEEGGSEAPPSGGPGTPVDQLNSEESSRLKRGYVLQELVETERAYVQDLMSITDGYMASLDEMELSEEDREKMKIVFANISQILDFHKTYFLKEIEKSLVDYEACGQAFLKYERRLQTYYVKYCQNKPKSDFLVSHDQYEQMFLDIKEKLGHKVALNDLLIKPVQRITKYINFRYQLMLSDILKYTHRANDKADVLERAHSVMRVVPKACDDMMQVGRLQGFEGRLSAQGRLIYQGTLFISDGGIGQPFKGKERRVFLFEQSAIIAECIPPRKEYGNPTYNFKNQIMVNKMIMEEQAPDDPLRFVLRSNDPAQPAVYVAQAASADDKEQWLLRISAQLDQQKTFLAALCDPKKYQSQLASSVAGLSIGPKKDSSGSLGTPTSPGPISPASNSPRPPQHSIASVQKSSSKLFGFGKK